MYFFSRIDSGIIKVRHEGPITTADSRQLRAFLQQYRGKLLIDLTGTPDGDNLREFCRVRAMLPQTAFIGPMVSDLVCQGLPGKDFYLNEVLHFADEADALAWLRGEEVSGADAGEEASVAA